MSYKYCLLFIGLFLASGLSGQSVNWMNWSDLNDSLRIAPKPVLVFITANWCPYCKLQDRKTFTKTKVVADLQDYYCLRLDAEEPAPITFRNRAYRFRATGRNTGTHELARFLGTIEGNLVLPTTVLLNGELQLIVREQGYLDAPFFRKLLRRARKQSTERPMLRGKR